MRILKKIVKKIYHLIWFLSLFLIFSLNVFAREIGSFTLARSGTLTSDYLTLYQGSGNFANWGLGTLIYTFGYTTTNTGSLNLPILTSAYADSGGSSYVCEFGSVALTSPSISTNATTGISYTIACPMVMGSNGLTNLGLIFSNQFNSAYAFNYSTSYSVEFISEDTFSSSDIVNAIAQNAYYTQQVIINESNDLSTILNNLNQNIQNTINNQNQNTQDIINNQNSNTQSQIESQRVCSTRTKQFIHEINGKYLTDGGTASNYSLSISNYLEIGQNKSYTINQNRNINGSFLCLYKEDKSISRCIAWNTNNSRSFTSQSDEFFVRTTLSNSGTASLSGLICENGNQAIDDSLNNIDDTLNNSSVDSSDNTINSLKTQIPTNSVISDLLLLPVRFLQNFVNALGSSCSTFSLGSLYGTELFMPCINIESYLGSAIWTAIDLIISGMFVYSLRKKFIEIYMNLTNLKNGGNEVD